MLKGGGTASRGKVERSNPSPNALAAGDVNSKVPSSRGASSNTNGKKRSESASTSAAAVGPKSKEIKQTTAQSPQDISDTGSEETDLSTSGGDDSSWISWFCGLRGNELLCKVDEEYIQDDFNFGEIDGNEQNEIESAAELLYGLVHFHYIVTSKGLNAMILGTALEFFCGGQPCLPVGPSDIPRNGSVKIYCPKCEDLYFPRCKYRSIMYGWFLHRHNVPPIMPSLLDDLSLFKTCKASSKLCVPSFQVRHGSPVVSDFNFEDS